MVLSSEKPQAPTEQLLARELRGINCSPITAMRHARVGLFQSIAASNWRPQVSLRMGHCRCHHFASTAYFCRDLGVQWLTFTDVVCPIRNEIDLHVAMGR